MFCRFCGTELPDDAVFCSKCGKQCAEQIEPKKDTTISFDDELTPIEKPPKAPPQKKEAPKKSHRNQTMQKIKLESEIDQDRIYSENGSGNVWIGVCGNRFYMADIDLEESTGCGLSVRKDASNTFYKVLDGIDVESFKINKKYKRIIYQVAVKKGSKLHFELWACDLDGQNRQKIAGDATDDVNCFAVTENWIFVVIKNSRDEQFVYQISSDLRSAEVIMSGVDIRRPIAANDQYIYYAVSAEQDGFNPNKMMLVEYEIGSKTEQIVFDQDNGIKEFQLYRNHIVLSTYTNCMFAAANENGLWLLDPRQDLYARFTSITCKATNLNCYADHIFYTDDETGYVYALSMLDRTIGKVYQRRAKTLNMAWGLLQLIDYDTARMVTLELFGRAQCSEPGYTGWTLPLHTMKQGGKNPRYISAPKKKKSDEQKLHDETLKDSINHTANSEKHPPEAVQSSKAIERNLTSAPNKSGISKQAIIVGAIAVVMICGMLFGKGSDETQKSEYNTSHQESSRIENTVQSNDSLNSSAITISDFIGDYTYDASFENPDGTWTNFCYSLSIEAGNDGVLVSEIWRGIYIFSNDWASQNDLDGNTLYFVVRYGENAGTHALTYIPAAQSPYESDTIYIDGDMDMPFTRDGYTVHSSPYSDIIYDDSYILPTDTEYITESDLYWLSKEQISFARNEIYARYGYSFKSEAVREYFSQQSWYYEDPDINANTFGVNDLSGCERVNLETIQQYERDMGWK